MMSVIYACIPCVLGAVYFFGLRVLFVLAVCCAVAFFFEWIFTRKRGEAVTSAIFVTAILFALTLPPTVPLGVAVIGIIVAAVFGKMAFGGFGRNTFNPALVGRCFIYVCFPGYMAMASGWAEPLFGGAGGFAAWRSIDALTTATPVQAFKDSGALEPLANLLWGNVGGSYGATSSILIAIGGIYILYKRAANWRIVLSVLGGAAVLSAILYFAGAEKAAPPLFTLLSGGLLFGAVFMATDPISASQTSEGMYIYGALIGALTVLIRAYSGFPEGVTFAILIGNMFAPITDYYIKAAKQKRKAREKAGAKKGGPQDNPVEENK